MNQIPITSLPPYHPIVLLANAGGMRHVDCLEIRTLPNGRECELFKVGVCWVGVINERIIGPGDIGWDKVHRTFNLGEQAP